MKIRNTIILIVVAVAIGSFIWFFERKQMSTQEWEEKGKRVFRIEGDDIDRIELVRADETVVCVKDSNGEWQMEQPLRYKADKSQLRSFCSRFESLDSKRILKGEGIDEKKIEEFGLKKPRVTARFRIKDNEEGIALGDETPLGNNVYSQVLGQRDVYILAKTIFNNLNKSANNLRDKGVVEFEIDDLVKAEVKRGKETIEFTQEEGEWRLNKPIKGLGDPNKISGMLRKIKNLRVKEFISDGPKNLAEFGLDEPLYELALWSKEDQSPKTVLFGKWAEKNTVYAKIGGGDTIFTVNDKALAELKLKPEEFRDRSLTHLSSDSIKNIKIEKGAKKLVMAKDGAKWKLEEPERENVETAQVRDLLRQLSELKAGGFIEYSPEKLKGLGLEEEPTQITLDPKDGEAESFLIGSKLDGDKKVYVKRGHSDEILIVASDFLRDLSLDPLYYRDREILNFNSADVKRLVISQRGKPRVVCEKDDNNWQMVEPEGSGVDKRKIDTILASLSRLRTKRLVESSPESLKSYGLDKPPLKVTVEIDKGSGEETKTLLVGKKTKLRTYYAKLMDQETVFTIPSHIEKNLCEDLKIQKPAAPTGSEVKDKTGN